MGRSRRPCLDVRDGFKKRRRKNAVVHEKGDQKESVSLSNGMKRVKHHKSATKEKGGGREVGVRPAYFDTGGHLESSL